MAKQNTRQDRIREVANSLRTFQDTMKQQLSMETEINALKKTIGDLNSTISDMNSKMESHQTYIEASMKVSAMREREKEKKENEKNAKTGNSGSIDYWKRMLEELSSVAASQGEMTDTMHEFIKRMDDKKDAEENKEDNTAAAIRDYLERQEQRDKERDVENRLNGNKKSTPDNSGNSEKSKPSGSGSSIFSILGSLLLGGGMMMGGLLGGGLGKMMGGMKIIGSGVLSLGAKILKGVFSMLKGSVLGIFRGAGKLPGMLMKLPVVGGVIKLFSKFLTPLNALFSMIQGVVDFFDTDAIAKKLGISKGKVSMFDRIMAGLEGFVAKFVGNLIDPFLQLFGIDFSVEDFLRNGFGVIEKAIDSAIESIKSKGFKKWAGDLTHDMMRTAEAAMKSMWDSIVGSITAMKDGILDWLESQEWMPDVAKEKMRSWRGESNSVSPSQEPPASLVAPQAAPKMYDDTSNATSKYFDPTKSGLFGQGKDTSGTPVPFYELHASNENAPQAANDDTFLNPRPIYKPLNGGDTESNLLNVIGQKESGGNYNIIYGGQTIPLTDMSIGEVLDYQTRNMKNGSTAVGKYQFIHSTLKAAMTGAGLSEKDMMSPENQDKMAIYLLKKRGLDDYKSGRISDKQFASNLALEWASLPLANGKSAYDGVMGNSAQMSYADFMSTVQGNPVDVNRGSDLLDSQRNISNSQTTAATKPSQVQVINNNSKNETAGNMTITLRNDEPSFKKIIEQFAFNSMGVTGSPLSNS